MTILTSPTVIGVDVAKAEIVVYREDLEITQVINNDRTSVGRWLKTLPAQSSIALEATNLYHLDTAELAHGMGHRVYVVDPYRVSHYRESIGQRAKADPCDARLLPQGNAFQMWERACSRSDPRVGTKRLLNSGV
nr:transposase [Pseudomonas koreensis]